MVPFCGALGYAQWIAYRAKKGAWSKGEFKGELYNFVVRHVTLSQLGHKFLYKYAFVKVSVRLIDNKASRLVVYPTHHKVRLGCHLQMYFYTGKGAWPEATVPSHGRPKAAKAEKPREIAGMAVEMAPRSVELNASEEGVNVERYFHGRKHPASPSLHNSVRNELPNILKPSTT